MEEGEAAAVGREPPAQIVPAADFVHRLIGDDLLQHDSRAAPVDPLDRQEAAVEPRDASMRRMSCSNGLNCGCLSSTASTSSRIRTSKCVAPGATFIRRISSRRGNSDASASSATVSGEGALGLGLRRRLQPCGLGEEIEREEEMEELPLLFREARVQADDRIGARHAGRLAALGQKVQRERFDAACGRILAWRSEKLAAPSCDGS